MNDKLKKDLNININRQFYAKKYNMKIKPDTFEDLKDATKGMFEECLTPEELDNFYKDLEGFILKLQSETRERTLLKLKGIKKDIKPKKPECDCDCGTAYCNNLMHRCLKPTKHTLQSEWMYYEFKLAVLNDLFEELRNG